MKQFRLLGDLGSMKITAHSSLDAGARWKSDPDFYCVGQLEQIEDLGSGEIKRYKKPRFVPIQIAGKAEPKEKPGRVSLRQPKVFVEFSF